MNILVNIDALVRISGAASDEMTRPYLHGVHVCARRGVAGAVMVATNGHIMAVENDPAGEVADSACATISLNAIKQIQAAAKIFAKQGKIKPGMLWARISNDSFRIVWGDIETNPVLVMGAMFADGTFPDWERVVPKVTLEDVGTSDGFNVALLGDVVGTMPGKQKQFRFYQKESGSPAVIRGHEEDCTNWVGVIMPCRITNDRAMPWFMSEQRAADAAQKMAA